MTRSEVASPVGQYRPEVLILAPEAGEDANTLSLVAQCLELGLAIELDENWRLPTAPLRDLSAYRACLFPDSAKAKYDADLNAFQRGGGFLVYTKYFPVSKSSNLSIDRSIDPIEFNGRDIFTFQLANMLLQAGISRHHPDFVRTLRARPLMSIMADQKAIAIARYAGELDARWTLWKDPDCFFLDCNRVCAEATDDPQWQALMKATFQRVVRSHTDMLRTDQKISSQLENYVEPYVLLFSHLLMYTGHAWGDASLRDAGVTLGRFWYEHNGGHGARSTPSTHGKFGEDVFSMPAMYWLTKLTGDRRYAEMADGVIERTAADCMRPTGIWSHWVDHRGRHQAAWSRATSWALSGMVLSLEAVEPGSSHAERLLTHINKTYDGLANYQDPDSHLFHCVIDEPFTRHETSAACVFVHLYDRLQKMGVAEARHEPMIARTFEGLMPMCYRQGISAFCRGTDYGSPAYYRSRPLGYSPSSSFFAPTVAARL